jgi:endogenous inhibitor of DNA gyrase (YacG/DUF329 family)
MLKKMRATPAAAGHGPRMSDQLGSSISAEYTHVPSRNQQPQNAPAKPRQARLAEQLLRDRERHRVAATPGPDVECFGCGKSFVYRGPRGDNSGRFCSDECRIEYDVPGAFSFDPFKVTRWRVIAGGDPGHLVAPPMRRVPAHKCADGEYRGGFRINCRGCGKPFESLGWPYCSKGCKHASHERAANAADRAAVGIAAPIKRKCQECGGSIPRWRKGRQVSKATRFCSPKCKQRAAKGARKAPDDLRGVGSPQTAKKCPQNGPSLIGPQDMPLNVVGGYQPQPFPVVAAGAGDGAPAEPLGVSPNIAAGDPDIPDFLLRAGKL